MSTPVTMPQLGESVTEGTVTRWLKQPGDQVEVDEPLLEVSTDKVDTEIPSPVAGVLLSVAAPEDAIVEVGGQLGTIGAADEAAPPAPAAPAPSDSGTAALPPPAYEPPPAFPPPTASPAPAAQPVPEPALEPVSVAEQSAAQASQDAPPVAETSESEPNDTPASNPTAWPTSGTEVRLPELGESVTEGTVTRWLKQVGDDVAVDEPLVEVSTDKVDTEIPSPVAGTVLHIAADEDSLVEVGAVLAVVGSGQPVAAPPAPPAAAAPEAAPPETTQPTAVAAAPQASQPPVAPAVPPTPPSPAPGAPTQPDSADVAAAGAYVTPLVRKIATQSGIDLATVAGTGVGGRIRRQDVESAIAARDAATQTPAAPAPAPTAAAPGRQDDAAADSLRGRTVPMTRLRKVIAQRMVESLQTSAQLTTVVEVDVTAIARLRARVKAGFSQREGVNLTFLPFFALAVVEALKVHPNVNASINASTDEVTYHDQEALGVAVDTERGLLVPVIRDAGELNLAGLARRIADLAERTRTNKVTPDELSGGTFTITNTGSRGALFDTPIINQPQVGILGVGSIVKRPVVISAPDGGDVIAVHSMVYLALTYDHRIVDGADAARFLGTIKARLEEGAFEGALGL